MHGDHRAAAHRAAVALYGVILLIYKSSTLQTSLNYTIAERLFLSTEVQLSRQHLIKLGA